MDDIHWSINDLRALQSNEHYRKYYEQKMKLKEKYPNDLFLEKKVGTGTSTKESRKYSEEYRKLHNEYLKELCDIIFQPNSDFQKFTWDIMSELDKVKQERRTRGRLNKGIIEY